MKGRKLEVGGNGLIGGRGDAGRRRLFGLKVEVEWWRREEIGGEIKIGIKKRWERRRR